MGERMLRHSEISAFILAGGASTRMGTEKALLPFGGEPLLMRTARLLEPLVREVIIVGKPEIYSGLGLRAIPDQFVTTAAETVPARTPLVGIVTALSNTRSPWNLILACDLPYVTSEWVHWLLGRALDSGSQVVMPRTSRGFEPVAAVYHRDCVAQIRAALVQGIRKVSEALSNLRLEFIDEREWSVLDSEHRVLTNMNSPGDYAAAKEWWESKHPEK
jgi:molybdopterin-guanine dinucleotide biosynthesis protein A